ncbi:MAG: bifunctional [glutamate--ammonia ligase]-adenylyl-L-tyrosine phosphorylase/[glutamate--ammonia-ligase] adenylyltransferase [Woeseiaceae bacterium]
MWPKIERQLLNQFAIDAELLAPVATFFDQLSSADPDSATLLASATDHLSVEAVWRGILVSEFVRTSILADPGYLKQQLHAGLELPPIQQQALQALTDAYGPASALRRFRREHMLAIAWAECSGLLSLEAGLQQLSELADTTLRFALNHARDQMREKFGELVSEDGNVCELYAICMGKLGGGELNFSSDIDLVFAFSGDGNSDGSRPLAASEYCLREARIVIDLLDRRTAEGRVFRVDTRLRPFGDSGPLAVSLSALEGYLQAHGRDWERYAFVKARFVGRSNEVTDEVLAFERDVLRPFVYRRYLDFGVLMSLRDMKGMIAREVTRKDMQAHLKLGPGGIREIEFIVQSWQLIRGGNVPVMRTPRFFSAIAACVDSDCLTESEGRSLEASYRFLRQLENRLQALEDRQTHSLPTASTQRAALAIAMGFEQWDALQSTLDSHRDAVTCIFDALLSISDPAGESVEAGRSAIRWLSLEEAALSEQLNHLFAPDETALQMTLEQFLQHARQQSLESIAAERLERYIDCVLDILDQRQRKTESVLARMLAVANAVLRRSAYLSLLTEQPAALSRLADIASASQSVINRVIERPLLLDELLDTRQSGVALDRQMLLGRLQELQRTNPDADIEERVNALIRFAQAAWFHIAVADCLNLLPIMKVSDRLSDVAEIVLQQALAIAWDDLTESTGNPAGHEACASGFAVIGYGKLGGFELGYGSDLDIIFLHDLPDGETSGPNAIDHQRFVTRLARRLVHFLGVQTGDGQLYEIDTRLRPSGKSGFLVTSVNAFQKYQREDAWTWEHQALLRARAVAGDADVRQKFVDVRRDILANGVDRESLRDQVVAMRQKMRTHLSQSSVSAFDLKQGAGGIADIEFLVQYLVLKHANDAPRLLDWSDNIRQLDSLAEADVLSTDTANALQSAYRELREVSHRQSLDGLQGLVPPDRVKHATRVVAEVWRDVFGEPPIS